MSRTVPQYGAGPRRNGNPDLGGNLRLQGTTRCIVAVSRRLANRLNMSYAIVAHDSYSAIDLPASPVSKSALLSDIEGKHVKSLTESRSTRASLKFGSMLRLSSKLSNRHSRN